MERILRLNASCSFFKSEIFSKFIVDMEKQMWFFDMQ